MNGRDRSGALFARTHTMAGPKSNKIGSVRDWSETEKDGRFKFRLTSPIGTQNVNANNNNNNARQFVEGRKIVGTFTFLVQYFHVVSPNAECITLLYEDVISYLPCLPFVRSLDIFGTFMTKSSRRSQHIHAHTHTLIAWIPNKNISTVYRPFWDWRRCASAKCVCPASMCKCVIKWFETNIKVFACFRSFVSFFVAVPFFRLLLSSGVNMAPPPQIWWHNIFRCFFFVVVLNVDIYCLGTINFGQMTDGRRRYDGVNRNANFWTNFVFPYQINHLLIC